MNKTEFIAAVAEKAEISKKDSEKALKAFVDVVTEQLKAGDKVYAVCMEKMLAMFRMGEEPLSNGMNILGAHIDSPRIYVKQNPLYESEGMAYLDTHYYGGIKKYQWVSSPMAIHGCCEKTWKRRRDQHWGKRV